MKKRITFLMAALLLMSGLTWAQTRTEVVAYTLDGTQTGGTNGYATESEITQNGITWMVTGNTTMNPWRIGGKNLNGVDRPLYSTNALSDNVTKVVISNGTSNITVNSMTLIVSDNAAFTNPISTVTGTWESSSATTFERPADADWTNKYYKLVYNVTETSGSNKYAQFVNAVFYKEEGSAPAVATPTFNPASGTEFGNEGLSVTINCETPSVDIYYTLDGSDPDDESNPYSGPISLTETTTIKAVAYDGNENTSAVATATYTYVDPNAPGTENNPYTVAQARAAIDAGTGTQGVYATGIVSAIPTAYSTQHSNITFNMVDEEGDSDFLQAYRCGGDEAANVAVGDIAVVYGDLTKYGSTYEFGQGCQLVSLTHPTGYVEAPTFAPAGGTYAEAQTVTISCANPDAAIYYTLDGTEPTNASTPYTTAINVATTTTIKAIAYVGTNASAVTTATYNIVTLSNISAITEVGTAYEVQGTVVATNSRGFVMGDGTGYVYYYKNAAVSQSIGDKVNLSGTTGTYGHIIQFTNTATVTQATTSNYNGAPAATLITAVPDYSEGYHLSTYFEFEGSLTKTNSNYFITLGDAQIQVSYPTTEQGNALTALAGKDVRVKGYFAGINSSDKFTVMLESVAEVASTNPAITIASNTIDAPVEGISGTLTVTYQNITELYPEVDYCDAEGNATSYDWFTAEIDDDNNVAYTVVANQGEARVAHFRVYATDDEGEDVFSDIVTVNQDAYVAPVLDYATLPFEFNGGKADIEGTDGLTQEGLDTDYSSSPKLKFNTTGDWLLLHFNEQPGTLTFDIKGNGFSGGTFTVQTSEDGETYTDLATYTSFGSSVESEEFTNLAENVRYIKWIYTEKSNGNVALGNIVLDEYTGPVASISVADAIVSVPAEGAEGTLTVTYENISEIVADVYFCDADGQEFTYEWMAAEIDDDNNVEYLVEPNEGEARTAYFKVYAMDDEGELVYSNLVTVNQEAPVVPPTPGTWVLTDLADLTENDVFVIVGTDADDDTFALPYNGGASAAPSATAITIVENSISGEPAAELQWNLSGNTTDGYTFYPNGETETWLYCTNTNNGVRVGTNDNKTFKMDEDGYLVNDATSRVLSIYVNNGTPQDWRCYSNYNNNPVVISFYKKVETLPANSIVIEGYGESEGGYYLIASPFTVSPEDVQGMTEGEYDLYSFDEAEENEWRNYKAGAFTNLEPGKGYLYAHSTTVTLTFDGEAYNDEPIVLKKTAGGDFPGWNLVGNPYMETAYIDRDFYVMNPETGGEIITGEGNEIAPMQGFFVIADQDGEELEISTEPTEEGSKIVMNVNSNRGNIIDRAVVRFGEGRQLPKFMLNEDNTKLYIAKGEEEYAVARNEAKGEMNLNFEAAEDGTYTLDFTVVNVELDQFLLIDNKTGVSIDLLSSSSYTFEANTTDNASRFRVVFGITTTVSEENANTFAFYNNGNLILNNEGSAILNVVDVLGRIISSYNINGSESIHINAQAGVYMLQLVQGDKIQTQKIVVE